MRSESIKIAQESAAGRGDERSGKGKGKKRISGDKKYR